MQENINILNELKETGAAALLNTANTNLYAVPEGFFDALAANTLTNIFITSIPVTNVFDVPENYFENFAELVVEKINIKTVYADYNTVQYSVPEGYFDNLAANILQKVKHPVSVQQELEEIAPFLNSISKANVYTVPENYFGDLHPASFNVAAVKPQTKIISIGSKARKWVNYAAAACVAAVLFGGSYLYFDTSKSADTGTTTYGPLATMNVQQEISVLSDDEISNYLKDNSNMAVSADGDDDQNQNFDLQNFLQNISDQEIQNYLNQDSEDAKNGGGI